MHNLHSRTRRVLIASGFAVAIAAAPAAAILGTGPASTTPTAACPAGEIEDLYTDQCIPELAPNTRGGHFPTAGAPTPAAPAPNPECPGGGHDTCVPYSGHSGAGNIGNEGQDTIGDEEADRR